MLNLKCDVCERKIGDPCDMITVNHHCLFAEFDICVDCADPIERFLDRKGLIGIHDDEDEE